MLVLTRKTNEAVLIEFPGYAPITVTLLRVDGQQIRLGFDGPLEVKFRRSELAKRLEQEAARAAS